MIDSINPHELFSEQFKNWRKESEIVLDNIFGNDSRQLKDFVKIKYQPSISFLTNSNHDQTHVAYYKKGLDEAKNILESFINEIEEYWKENDVESNNKSNVNFNEIVELKPNFMGLGININALIRKLFKKR